jgi:hypothetical protein
MRRIQLLARPSILMLCLLMACRASSPATGGAVEGATPAAGLELPAAGRAHDAAPDGALAQQAAVVALLDAPLKGGRAVALRADRRVEAAWVAQLAALARQAGSAEVYAALSDDAALMLRAPVAQCPAQGEVAPRIDELGIAQTPPPRCAAGYMVISPAGAQIGALAPCEAAAGADLSPISCAAGAIEAGTLQRALREADMRAELCAQLTVTARDGASWGDVALALEAVQGRLDATLAAEGPALGACGA